MKTVEGGAHCISIAVFVSARDLEGDVMVWHGLGEDRKGG